MVNYIGGGDAALTDDAAADDDDDETEEAPTADDGGFLGLGGDDEDETAEAGDRDPADSEDDVDGDDFALLGVGDDLFEAFFSDDTPPPKKKKTTTEAPLAIVEEVKPVEVVKPAVVAAKPSTKPKKVAVKKPSVKKPAAVAVSEQVDIDSVEKTQLPFQHTPALLELANKKGTDENNKNEDNEINGGINQIADQLLDTTAENLYADDSDETGDDNMIIISSSEMHVPNKQVWLYE